jgi:RNA polymerase sigma factor (sigma-70 family)
VTTDNAVQSLVDHLFRRESGKMVSALTRVFGPTNLDLAEDVVQETLLLAMQRWPFDGVPGNPAGWLYQAAKHKAIDTIRRQQTFRRFEPELTRDLQAAGETAHVLDRLFLAEEIADDTLRMMFTCCHPALSAESQITLTLKILCGFGTAEIARAFMTEETAIDKRLYRAKRKIREKRIAFEVPAAPELSTRLQTVLSVLYLMFNEGYNSSFAEDPIRKDICLEAMRLGQLLGEHPVGRRPMTAALMALMCFHAARFDARVDEDGHLLTMRDQDRGRWDRQLVGEGFRYLEESASGSEVSHVHLEAGIAALHCAAETYESTNWEEIVRLYDHLMAIRETPIVALNRAIAIGARDGAEAGLEAIRAIAESEALEKYHLLPAALGEMHLQLGQLGEARRFFERAHALTSSRAERQLLQQKLSACGSG